MTAIDILGGNDAAEHEKVAALGKALVGRRVVEVRDKLPTEDPDSTDHGSVEIIFDDGSAFECGHDAWGHVLTYSPGD